MGFDSSLDVAVSQFGLGLALKLGVGELDTYDQSQTLTNILSAELMLQIAKQVVLHGIRVQGSSQCRLETNQVRAPLDGVNRIRK